MNKDECHQRPDDLDDAREEWSRELFDILAGFGREAGRLRLFPDGEATQTEIIRMAVLHLLCACDYPEDLAVCQKIVEQACAAAIRTMNAHRLH